MSVTKARARILVAEDNAVNQRLVVSILRNKHYDVEVVTNGVRAVEAARTGNYDLVIMDLQMPEMSGLDATIRIRESEGEVAQIPIIGLTAYAMIADRNQIAESGMNACLTKPIDSKELLSAISEHLAAARG